MASYRLTNRAEAKLAAIYEYSVLNWGLPKTREYLRGLHNAFELLAENPKMGRDMGELRSGLHRHAHASHVVYYRAEASGLLILDVLGERQDPGRHL